MKRSRSRSIRSQLVLLVIGCLVPALIMAVLLIFYDYHRVREQLVRNAMVTTRAMASAVDGDLAAVTSSLSSLATSPYLTSSDLAAFYGQAKDVLRQQISDNIVLSDVHGTHFINTLGPHEGVLPQRHSPVVLEKMAQTGRPMISDLFIGNKFRRPVIAVGVPVHRDGNYIYGLSAGIFPDRFARHLRQQDLPADWIGAIFDGNGVIIARTHDSARFVGEKGPSDVINRIREAGQGAFESVTREGIPVLTVFSRSAISNWTVAIGIPTETLTHELRRTLSWLIGAALLLLASSLAIAWLIGGRIAGSIHGLTLPALALGSGEAVTVPPLYLKEADDVGASLMKASEMLHQAQHQANHDVLTGLANRALFNEIVGQQLALCHRNSGRLSILYIDLDGFKNINDQYGHATGDKLLRAVAQRLKAGIREADVAARLGGDEFAVVLVDAATEDAEAVARKLVECISSSFEIEEVTLGISASIGVAGFPDCGTTSRAILHCADNAMYEAKAMGKRRVAVAKGPG